MKKLYIYYKIKISIKNKKDIKIIVLKNYVNILNILNYIKKIKTINILSFYS